MSKDDGFPTGAIINGRISIERLKNIYNFQCQAGSLNMCEDFIELERCFEHLCNCMEREIEL